MISSLAPLSVIPAKAGTQSFRIRQAAKADALGPRRSLPSAEAGGGDDQQTPSMVFP